MEKGKVLRYIKVALKKKGEVEQFWRRN